MADPQRRAVSPACLGALVFSAAIFIRLAVSLHPYSGLNNSFSMLFICTVWPSFLELGYVYTLVHMTAVTDCWLVQVLERLPCLETMRLRDTGWRSPTTYPLQNGTGH